MQPRIVLAANEVKRAAVEPGDQQRALLGQSPVNITSCQITGSRADRESRTARILALHRQQTLDHSPRAPQWLSGKRLRDKPLGKDHCSAYGLRLFHFQKFYDIDHHSVAIGK